MKNIFNYTLIILIVAVASACSKQTLSGGRIQTPPAGSAKKYLALGDSYTIGQGVEPAFSFPVQTARMLKNMGIPIADPVIIATTGWTTENLQAAITSQNITGPYDVVSLLIGVNDQYQGKDTSGYRTRFTSLLQQSIAFAGNDPRKVFVLSIPDYSVTPFAQNRDTARIRKEIDYFNAINKEITLAYNVHYLDITPSSREARNNATLIAADGLHPSGTEYKKWAERLAALMKPVLQ